MKATNAELHLARSTGRMRVFIARPEAQGRFSGLVFHLAIPVLIGATYGVLFHDGTTDDASALGWGPPTV